jgi:hypothetical protein
LILLNLILLGLHRATQNEGRDRSRATDTKKHDGLNRQLSNACDQHLPQRAATMIECGADVTTVEPL